MHPSSSASDRAVQKQRRMAAAAFFPEAHLESRAFASQSPGKHPDYKRLLNTFQKFLADKTDKDEEYDLNGAPPSVL